MPNEFTKVRPIKCELYHDSFQNFKKYNVPKAQLVIADVPYNVGNNMYGSSPVWYKGGTIRTERARKRARRPSTAITTSICMNISISATGC